RLALAVIAIAVLGHAQAAVFLRRSVRGRHADAGPVGTRPPSLRVHRVPALPATVRPGGRRRASGQPRADRGSDGTLPARRPGCHRAPAPTEAARRLGRHADGRARVRGATAVEGCTPADQCCFLSHTRYAVTAETWSSLISLLEKRGIAPTPLRIWIFMANRGSGLLFSAGPSPLSPPG